MNLEGWKKEDLRKEENFLIIDKYVDIVDGLSRTS